MVKIRKGKKTVACGRNLRILGDYRRRIGGHMRLAQSGRVLLVRFSDGARCSTEFADAWILQKWIVTRILYGRGNVGAIGSGVAQ